MIAVVDAGPLYAVADADDRHHDACFAVMSRADLQLVVAGLAVAEATYFVGSRLTRLSSTCAPAAITVDGSQCGRPQP